MREITQWNEGPVSFALSWIAVSSFSPGSCPRSLYYIVDLYNADFPSLVLQCHTLGRNISDMKKQLPPSSWYTCVYKGNEVCPTLTQEQIKTVHLRTARERYTKCCVVTSCNELYWNWERNTDFTYAHKWSIAFYKLIKIILFQLLVWRNHIQSVIEIHTVGPCHHSMARPQVVDRGTASDKEGSCK